MSDELAQRIELAWESVARRAAGDPPWLRDLLVPLITSARTRPELAALFPFTSMNRLCFSRCSEYPFTLDCPCVAVDRSGYVVQKMWTVAEEAGPRLLEATFDLDRALQVVLEHLPPERSTWLGTRDDRDPAH